MTALMSQVLCGLCYEKIDYSKWKDQIISSNNLLKCKTFDSSIATIFLKCFLTRDLKKKTNI